MLFSGSLRIYILGFYINNSEYERYISFISIVILLYLFEFVFLVFSHVNLGLKEMAPHSSTLAWKIPWMEEPGGLQSMGSLSQTWLNDFTFTHWRRKWQPTPVFLPGEFQEQGSLEGCRLWGHTVRHDWSDLAAAAVKILISVEDYLLFLFIIFERKTLNPQD